MSTLDHILLADVGTPRAIAARIAARTSMAVVRETDDRVVLGRPARGRHGLVHAEIRSNYLGNPREALEDRTLVDLLPTLVSFWYTGVDRDHQYSAAVNFFIELADSATTAALLRGLDTLVAVSTLADGIVWMPPGTTPDPPDRELWLPYVPVPLRTPPTGGRLT